MILIQILPVKMLLGHRPTPELLKKYHLLQFAEVTKAVKGGMLLSNVALTKHKTFFICCGTFLTLEKLKCFEESVLVTQNTPVISGCFSSCLEIHASGRCGH